MIEVVLRTMGAASIKKEGHRTRSQERTDRGQFESLAMPNVTTSFFNRASPTAEKVKRRIRSGRWHGRGSQADPEASR